jgi:hypothetical protein
LKEITLTAKRGSQKNEEQLQLMQEKGRNKNFGSIKNTRIYGLSIYHERPKLFSSFNLCTKTVSIATEWSLSARF